MEALFAVQAAFLSSAKPGSMDARPKKAAPKTRHTLSKRLHKTVYDTSWALTAYLSYRTPFLFGLSSERLESPTAITNE